MALARALAVEPRVLLLDEPFGALDAKVRADLRAWLRRLHEDVHVTTVLVTHDQEEAMDVADRIVVLQEGRIEQAGAPRELYDTPATPFVMSFLGEVSRLGEHLVRPHDLALGTERAEGAVEAQITRIVHLGFEVRVELAVPDAAEPVVAQLTRHEALELELRRGDIVWVRPTGHAFEAAHAAPVATPSA
jgi:sulfate transport system ATP-binding protein